MGYSLRPETMIWITAAQTTPELSLCRELELALQTAENKCKMALQADNGDMWARAWESVKELQEQLTLMLGIEYGYVVPLLNDDELMEG
jgi:hypothetical protein